nr:MULTISPECIES: hypothetical protein [Pseudomonas]
MSWYKVGTVSVTPGSNAVIGTGTSFIANSRVGDAFRGPDGGWYEVTNIASNTALSISPGYQGAADASGTYALAPMQGYVKESADALRAATQVIASGVADMEQQVATATEAAQSAAQSKAGATEQAGIATSAAGVSTENKNAAQLAAEQSQSSAQVSGTAADRSEDARDSIVQSEQAAAASAEAAEQSAAQAEQVTIGKADKGDNNDITSLLALSSDGFDKIRLGLSPVVGATATAAGKKGLVPAPGIADRDKFLKGDGTYGEVGGGLPVGAMTQWKFSRATIPGGQLALDGQIVTNGRALYPELWALLQPFCVTDAVWLAAPYTSRGLPSSGNGSTDFRLPDDNGKHPDGLTIAAMVFRGDGKNSAGTPGLHQADQMQGFRVAVPFHAFPGAAAQDSFGKVPASEVDGTGTSEYGAGNTAVTNGYKRSSKAVNDGVNGVPRTGTETRSASTTGIWCIVAAKTAVNAGTVDVPALATAVATQGAQIQSVDSLIATTFVYPNGGSAATPANVAAGARYIVSNPYPGFQVICEAQIFYNNTWGTTGYAGNIGSGSTALGTFASQTNNGDIVTQVCQSGTMFGLSAVTGGSHGSTTNSAVGTMPCRVKVTKTRLPL